MVRKGQLHFINNFGSIDILITLNSFLNTYIYISSCDAGDLGSIPRSKRSLGDKWQPTPVFLPGKFHGLKSLVDCSPWGRKELDATEQLNNNTHSSM